MQPGKVVIFGLFGQGNVGNECTLQAILHHIRTKTPAIELLVATTDPLETTKWHGVTAVSYSARPATDAGARDAGDSRSRLKRIFALLGRRMPVEVAGWFRAFRALKGASVLAMTGTGMLTDYNCGPLGRPYEIFKWSVVARLRGCKVRFVSVGVGPLRAPLSRWFFKAALRLADLRCYRDEVSRRRIEAVGLDTSRDHVFPDLAFSLPKTLFRESGDRQGVPPVIAVGVMDFYGHDLPPEARDAAYRAYLAKTADFIAWLITHEYAVRILHGDTVYDRTPRADLRAILERRGFTYGGCHIVDDDMGSVEDLISQLESSDLIVSPRFHNQLLGLMLGKPVIAISYDAKSEALLEGLGLRQYCQPIDALNVDKLVEQLVELRHRFDTLRDGLRLKTEEYRTSLDDEYRLLFSDVREGRRLRPFPWHLG